MNIFDVRELFKRTIIYDKLFELHRNAKLRRAQLEQGKLQKFRKLVFYAYRHSPYYKKLIKDLNIDVRKCVPTDFPILTKSTLTQHFDEIVTDREITREGLIDFLFTSKHQKDLFLNKYQVLHSSGSSGEMGYFLFSQIEWFRGLTQGLRLKPISKIFEPRKYAFYGAVDSHSAGASVVNAGIHAIDKNGNDIRLYEINTPIETVVDQLNAFQPQGLGGYASSLKKLAQKQQEGILNIKPKWLEGMGEAVSASDRAYLEDVFGCGIYNLYGSSENLLMGIEVPDKTCMTLYDDDLIYEFEKDHTVITNLFNFTLPLIRYRLNDVLIPLNMHSASDPYLRIQNIIGRPEIKATFRNEDGDNENITSWNLAHTFAGVSGFQLHISGLEQFDFRICLEPTLTIQQKAKALGEVEDWLVDLLDKKRMRNIQFKIICVNDLQIDLKTRKFQLISNSSAVSNPNYSPVGREQKLAG